MQHNTKNTPNTTTTRPLLNQNDIKSIKIVSSLYLFPVIHEEIEAIHQEMTTPLVPGFLTKLYEIFTSPEYSDCCKWGANGDSIVIFQVFIFDVNWKKKKFLYKFLSCSCLLD